MKNSAIATLTIAMALTPAHAEAAKGLTKKQSRQVQTIVTQEVARALHGLPAGPPGPPGPAGPVGPGAVDAVVPLMRYAYVDLLGRVVESRSFGISQGNLTQDVRIFEGPASPLPDGSPIASTTYCFAGLGTIVGGQVVIDGIGGYAAVVSPKLRIEPTDVCPVQVAIHGFEQVPGDHREPPISASFYVLLY